MKFKIITISILSLLLITGCDNENEHDKQDDNEHAESTESHDESDDIEDQLSLNDGEKWKVNEEMMPYILQSEEMIDDFEGDDYVALADKLLELNNQLITSCTMSGPSHDELHKWLNPHIELFRDLKWRAEQEGAEVVFDEIEDSFDVFHEYFSSK